MWMYFTPICHLEIGRSDDHQDTLCQATGSSARAHRNGETRERTEEAAYRMQVAYNKPLSATACLGHKL
jgi:hypothetical protein